MIDNGSYWMLGVDLTLNLAGLVLGVLLMIKAHDNRLKMLCGILIAVCSLSMFVDNLRWLDRYVMNSGMDDRRGLLMVEGMFKWFVFAHALSMIPIASLRPGWLTPLRVTAFSLPLFCSSLVLLSYMGFNGEITPVDSLPQVYANLGRLDIQVRLAYFALSFFLPLAYFLIPFLGGWITLRRRLAPGMYIYLSGFCIALTLYVLFILDTAAVFDLYAFTVTFYPTLFAVFYLFNDDLLSVPRAIGDIELREETESEQPQPTVAPSVYKLHLRMMEFVDARNPFVDSEYTLQQLAADLGVSRALLIKAIQYRGFSGFNEYMNYMRLEFFKKLILSSPGASVKELMCRSGFTSRSSFYRHFTDKEKMSPKEYIDKVLSE